MANRTGIVTHHPITKSAATTAASAPATFNRNADPRISRGPTAAPSASSNNSVVASIPTEPAAKRCSLTMVPSTTGCAGRIISATAPMIMAEAMPPTVRSRAGRLIVEIGFNPDRARRAGHALNEAERVGQVKSKGVVFSVRKVVDECSNLEFIITELESQSCVF